MEQIFNKLVRDNIPNIIENNGEKAITRILSDKEYRVELYKKLLEESQEVINSQDTEDILEELADVLEELTTLCSCGNIARYVGRKRNGVFETDGEEVVIDGTCNIEYVPLCGECYLKKVKKINFKKVKGEIQGENRN